MLRRAILVGVFALAGVVLAASGAPSTRAQPVGVIEPLPPLPAIDGGQ